jgi:hypothetical protein
MDITGLTGITEAQRHLTDRASVFIVVLPAAARAR